MVSRRKTDHCFNCNYSFPEGAANNYCPECGQKNSDKQVSILTLISDFFSNYFSFDSKLFTTFIPLLFKPGFLTTEYLKGRHATYVSPVRIYLYVSILYFSLISGLVDFDSLSTTTDKDKITISTDSEDLEEKAQEDSIIQVEGQLIAQEINKKILGSLEIDSLEHIINESIDSIDQSQIKQHTRNVSAWDRKSSDAMERILNLADKYEQEVVLDSLKKEENYFINHWAFKYATPQFIKAYQQGAGNLFRYFFGSLPLMMFFVMPVFAFLFKILYIRKKQLYINHLIFHYHFHAFLYLMIGLGIMLRNWAPSWLVIFLIIVCWTYLYKAMRKVYQQGRFKSILKKWTFLFLYPMVIFIFAAFTLLISFLFF